jgi:hypothetical protein
MYLFNTLNHKSRTFLLLGASALGSLVLATPAMATDFTITGGSNTNGNFADDAFNGLDAITINGDLNTGNVNDEDGIETTGNSNKVTVLSSGTITTGGSRAAAILNQGNGNETTVSGSITTTGDLGRGIVSAGNKNITTVSGSIKTENGIYNPGNDNKTTVSGSIVTIKHGIENVGNDTTTTVSGSITTTGDLGRGITNFGDGNETTVSGSIITDGAAAPGIVSAGNKNITTVSGSITTEKGSAYGIYNQGNENETSVLGSIKTKGYNAWGIWHHGNTNTATISGSIITGGVSAHGIFNLGNDNTTTISGTVSATGTDASALYNYAGSGNSFTLNEGATIIGNITAAAVTGATNNKLMVNLGQGASYAYSVGGSGEGTGAGQWIFTDQDGHTPVVTSIATSNCTARMHGGSPVIAECNLVTAVGSGNAMEHNELQLAMNASLMGSLQSGSSQANNLTEAMASPQASKSNTWVNVYGASSKRASSTTQSAFDTSNAGLSIGIPMAISDRVYMDLVFNTSKTNLDIGLTKDQEITAQAYNLGAVVRDFVASDTWSVDAFGFIGRNAYDGKRKVMNNQQATGSESVTAAYSGMAVLVGVDAQFSNPINNTLSFIGGVNASLSNEKIGAYSESKYFAWDARTMTQTTGGITTGLEYHTDALTTFASLGAQRSSLRSGKTAGYTNNGTAGSYTDSTTDDTYRTASIGFDYAAADGMSVTGALERLSSTSGVSGNSTSLSVNKTF